jgi:hypothetical protein
VKNPTVKNPRAKSGGANGQRGTESKRSFSVECEKRRRSDVGSRFSQETGSRKSLPAIAAIAPVAPISTIAAATAAATTAAMSTTASAATAAETASATTTPALLLGTSFVDDEIAAAKVLAVHGIDRAIRFFVIGDFDERETTRLAREPITNEIDCRGINTSL